MNDLNSDLISIDGVDRPFSRKRMLAVLLMPLMLGMMSISAINVALTAIAQGIGASDSQIQWLLSGYALSFGIVLVAAGRIGDVLGRGALFVIGMTIFGCASLACGLADDPNVLNAARFIQGLGTGLAAPQTNGMIVQYWSGQARARAFALFGLAVSVGVSIGPVLTGFLIGTFGPQVGWRASFLINFPLALVTVILALCWFPFETERRTRAARRAGAHVRQKIDLDPVGMVLLMIAVLGIMVPFMLRTGLGWLLLPVGLAILAGWISWERAYKRRGHAPMVDLDLFKIKSFTNATAVGAVNFLGSTSIFMVLMLFMQQGLHASAMQTGLIGLPNAFISAVAALWAGKRVLQRGRTLSIWGMALSVVTMLLLISCTGLVADGKLNVWWMGIFLMIQGWGIGIFGACNQTLSQLEIVPAVAGTAGGVKQTAERTATAIGNAMMSSIIFSALPLGWVTATRLAYGAIAVILTVCMLLAIYDLRTLGDPGIKPGRAAA